MTWKVPPAKRRRGLSLAADLVLLDKQLHKAALMPSGVFRHLPKIGENTGGQQVCADKVRRTVAGALLVAAAKVGGQALLCLHDCCG